MPRKETGSILVVIDMQPSFTAARNKTTIKNCAREIRNAIKLRHRIVFLEYVDERPTHKSLINLVKKIDYDKYSVVTKYEDDGSRTIVEILKGLNREKDRIDFIVCGVNSDACIKRTVFGLARRSGSTVRVIKDACNQPSSFTGSKDAPFMKMGRKKNVVIV